MNAADADSLEAHATSSFSSPSLSPPLSTASSDLHGPKWSTSASSTPSRRAPARRQRKKPCHIAQKERKASLVQELIELEARVAALRRQAGAPSVEDVQSTQARILDNYKLQSALQTQQMLLANMQGSFSSYTNRLYQSPVSTLIHLPGDWDQRRKILMGMRDDKILVAHQFLTERTRMMDPLQETCEESMFRSPEGDYYAVKLDNTPFMNVSSVDEMMQTFHAYFQHAEVSMSVSSDAIITREGEEVTEEGISSHRFYTTFGGSNVQVEKNSVGFTGVVSSDADGPTSIVLAMDAIDQDDTYPYRPDDRVRSDLSGVVQFRTHRLAASQRPGGLGSVENAGPTLAVVLTRWYHVKVHRTHLPLPQDDMERIQGAMLRVLDHMLKEIKWQVQQNRQRA